MRKLIACLMVMVLCGMACLAQEQSVRLKNGSRIYGKISYYYDEVSITTRDGNTYIFPLEELAPSKGHGNRNAGYYKKGFQASLTAGIGACPGEFDIPVAARLVASVGERFNHANYLGFKTGVEMFPAYLHSAEHPYADEREFWDQVLLIGVPLCAEYRLYPCARSKAVQPYIAHSAGVLYAKDLFVLIDLGVGANFSLVRSKKSSNRAIFAYPSLQLYLPTWVSGRSTEPSLAMSINVGYTF